MAYGKFASIYDVLMKEAPYDKWVELVTSKKEKYNVQGQTILDLGCGTGEVSVRLAERGLLVTGIDLSEEMLSIAYSKSLEKGYSIHFLQQDMSELEDIGEYDCIVILCDSLNYLSNEEEVLQTLKGVYRHLKEGGLFIFDVHSTYKLNQIFLNQTYALNEEDVSYIWKCYEGDFPHSVEHELTFFVLDKDTDHYRRFDELHIQRTFPIDNYSMWLKEAGFHVQEIIADFEDKRPEEESERIFFICKKP